MARRMTVREAGERFADLLAAVGDEKEVILVEEQGNPLAVVIRPEDFAYYQELARREFFKLVSEIHERNRDLDPDEVLRDVTEVVEEVRQARYDRGR